MDLARKVLWSLVALTLTERLHSNERGTTARYVCPWQISAIRPDCASSRLAKWAVFRCRERLMPRWRKKLFALMARNAQSATAFFQLPPNRVVELGAQIQF